MKKVILMAAVAACAFMTKADVAWSWWLENESAKADVSLGIASRVASCDALELSLLYSASPVTEGVQFTLWGINNSDASCALQLAPWFNRGADPCVQLGLVNLAKAPVFSWGFINIAEAAKFQLGFLNFDKKGFLPVFIFVNFDPAIFK